MSFKDDLKIGVTQYTEGCFNDAKDSFENFLEVLKSSESEATENYYILLWLSQINLDLSFTIKAEELAHQATKSRKKELPTVTTKAPDLEFIFAKLSSHRGFFLEAEEQANFILQERISREGYTSLPCASALYEQGRLLTEAAKFDLAESALKKALALSEKLVIKDDLFYAAILAATSTNYILQGNIVMAEPFCKNALAIRETVLKADHFLLGTNLHLLATIELSKKRLHEAEMLWRRALAIHEQKLPPNHPQICLELIGVAQALNADFRYNEAAIFFEKALIAAESAYPMSARNLFASVSGLGLTYLAKKEFDKAEPYIRRALVILRESSDLQPTNERRMIESLMISQLWQGKLVDAISLYPDQMRAKHTTDFAGMIRLFEKSLEFLQKNVLPSWNEITWNEKK